MHYREITHNSGKLYLKNVMFLVIYNYIEGGVGVWKEKRVSTEAFCQLPYFLGN